MNWMTLQTVIASVSLPLMALLPGVFVLTARLTRPDIFFSFTVEPTLRQSAAGLAILRQFNRTVILSALAGLALTLSGAVVRFTPALGLALIVGGMAVESAGMIAAYATARQQVKPHQVEPSREREVALQPRPTRPVGGWLGQVGPFLILALAAVCLWWQWDAIPARFPVHWNWYGRPDGWAVKSARSVFGSVLLGASVCLLLGLMMNGMARGVRRIHSRGLEGEQESRFLRRMLLLVLWLEYFMAAAFGFSPILPPRLTAVLMMTALPIAVASLVVALTCGQGGWRLKGQAPAAMPAGQAPAGDRTPDVCWKWGLFYYNPADPALWVEKRFGIGWTVNFGNPRAWFVMGGILLFAVAVSVASVLLMK
jgi:uncharacterized membrane protein